MNLDEHRNLLAAIRAFVADQQKVREILLERLLIDPKIAAMEWAVSSREIKARHDRDPFARKFDPHGYGLHFENDELKIDFDYCETGRPDGFDSWRLCLYGDAHPAYKVFDEDNKYSAALEEMKVQGFIEREKNLYFLTLKGSGISFKINS